MSRTYFFCALLAAAASCSGLTQASALAQQRERGQTRLGIDGVRFTLNGKPEFLLGISYYGALAAEESAIRKDLDSMQAHGLNWFRVWATWNGFENDVAAVTPQGKPREPYLSKLAWLVEECDRRRLVVDVSISRGKGAAGPPRLTAHDEHLLAVESIVTALRRHSNWYLDLSNERNIRDSRYTGVEELRVLRQRVRELDPSRLVTASHGGDIEGDDLRDYVERVRVDFITPHRPRDDGSPAQTEAKTRQYLAMMKEIGRVVPVHYQEPFRRGYADWNPRVEDFLTDLRGAQHGGAAGWCLHNGSQRTTEDGKPRRSFDVRELGLFEQLDEVETAVLNRLQVRGE